jgi:hypothetical protein
MSYSCSDYVADITSHARTWGVLTPEQAESDDLQAQAELVRDAMSTMLAQRSILLLLVNQAVERVKLLNGRGDSILSAWLQDAEQVVADVAKACGLPAARPALSFPDRMTLAEARALALRQSQRPENAGRPHYVEGSIYLGSEGRPEVASLGWRVTASRSRAAVLEYVDGRCNEV